MSRKCFEEYISAKRGAVFDCYNAEYDASTNQLNLLGLEISSDTIPCVEYTTDDLEDAVLTVVPGINNNCAPCEGIMDHKLTSFLLQ